MKLLDVKDLEVQFATPEGSVVAVNKLNFSLEKGQTLGIVGESGSGKSQTAFALMGLLAKNGTISGSAKFEGQEILNLPEQQLNQIRAKQIAMIFQEPMTSLNPYLKVGSQLIEPLVYHHGVDKQTAWKKSVGALERVGIPDASKVIRVMVAMQRVDVGIGRD